MTSSGTAAAHAQRDGRMLSEPHHDGSDGYVLERPAALGEQAVVRLRVPRASSPEAVLLRYVRDGEPRSAEAEVDEETETETWWRASFPVANPATRYRWLLVEGESWTWVNGLGPVAHDVPDADDFVMTSGADGPSWHPTSVVYEIFPDRFAASGAAVEPPEWAVPRAWDELPTGRGPETSREWFGGDLRGVAARLDHVERLGANVIYLTPFFPARSTHRYDSTSFERVDPLLGGDEALASLVAAAHARGFRVVGDLTMNHCGSSHEWFVAARAEPGAVERELFLFDDALPDGYESWLGIPSLPKLNWRSPRLSERMLAVVRRWLEPPYSLDGWRIDVANMTARHGADDLNAEVARNVRRVVGEGRADALLVAEHGHDFRGDLAVGGWHGAMNYSGFLRPAWTWLRADEAAAELRRQFWGLRAGVPRTSGERAVTTMRAFRAGVPWSSVLHSWTLLDSHDTARFRTVAGSSARHAVGVGLQMTTPGVPMLFAGDELGLEGEWGEDARRPMPWERPESWDHGLYEEYRRLIALRRSSPALATGGLRYAAVSADAIAYVRETRSERLLCLASRATHDPVSLPLSALGCDGLETIHGGDAAHAEGDVILPGEGPAFSVWRLV